MHRFLFASFLLSCLAIYASAHTWVDCATVDNPTTAQATNDFNQVIGQYCSGFPRGFTPRTVNPDANLHKVGPGITEAEYATYPACNQPTAAGAYSANYPMAQAAPGQTLAFLYLPNGHTEWHNPPPPNGVKNWYLKWTGVSGTNLMTMSDVRNAASIAGPVQFDIPCHSRITGAELDSSGGLCMGEYTIPANTAPGTYQIVWWWEFDFQGGNVIEEYVSCWDVQVSGTPVQTTTGVVPVTTGIPATTGTTGFTVPDDSNAIYAVEDAFVRGGQYSNDNYGDNENLIVKDAPDDAFSRESYLKFDLSDIEGTIVSAQLVLSIDSLSSETFDFLVGVSTSDWSENTLNFNNRPESLGEVIGFVNSALTDLDVDGLQAAIDEDGMLTLHLFQTTNADELYVFFSSENPTLTRVPQLLLEIDDSGDSAALVSASFTLLLLSLLLAAF